MDCTRRAVIAALGTGAAFSAKPALAQLGTVLSAPVTLIDRALEDRSTSDIAKDNEIVIKVNAVMAKVESIKASTEIYEQRLLVTGLFDDKPTYDKFETGVQGRPPPQLSAGDRCLCGALCPWPCPVGSRTRTDLGASQSDRRRATRVDYIEVRPKTT